MIYVLDGNMTLSWVYEECHKEVHRAINAWQGIQGR